MLRSIRHFDIPGIARDVHPLVEDLMEADFSISDLQIKLLNPLAVFREEQSHYSAEEMPRSPSSWGELHGYLRQRFWSPFQTPAEYLPTQNVMFFVPFVFRTNESAAATLIGHELTHVAQYQFDGFFSRKITMDERSRTGRYGTKFKDLELDVVNQILATHLLLEGDAVWIERQLSEKHFPNGAKRPSLMNGLIQDLGVFYSLIKYGRLPKTREGYTHGYEFIGKEFARSGRSGVNALYGLDFPDLVAYFETEHDVSFPGK